MIKTLKNKYKDLKMQTQKIKEKKEGQYIRTENVERIFPIEVIASTFENRLLANNYEIIRDFWSFITNESVDLSNITRFNSIIEQEILEQHPNLKILDYSSGKWYLDNDEIDYIKKWYREQNGDFIAIKSIKKGYEKVLKMQER